MILMKEPDPSRRRFLVRIVIAINALVAALVATPAVGYLLSPLLKRRSGQWVVIDQASATVGGPPRRVMYRYRDERGYDVQEMSRAAFVTQDNNELVVLSPVCTHMGCNVGFNDATNLFECPCHGGKYDTSGRVVDGPPPEPLRRFKTRLRDGNLEIYIT